MKKELLILPVAIVLAFVIGLSINNNTQSTSDGMSLKYSAVQCVYKNGELIECNPNLFNTDGMNFTRDLMSAVDGNGTASSLRFISVGNKTGTQCLTGQVATDTFLCGEYNTCGLSRGVADAIRLNSTAPPTSGNWTITKEFTATGSCDVNSTGLFNTITVNQSNEVFFAQNTFTTASLSSNDKLNITWFIWVS